MNDNVNGIRNDINYIDVLCVGVENNIIDCSGIEIGSSDVVKLFVILMLIIMVLVLLLVIISVIDSDSYDIK